VGPTRAGQFGYLPGALWIIVGAVLGGAVQAFVLTHFGLSPERYGRNQLRYDLREMKARALLERDGARYAYRLTEKSACVCGCSLAISLLLHVFQGFSDQEQEVFLERPRHHLQADGQSLGGTAAGHRKRGETEHIHSPGET
jgi:hypothetical protein